MILILKVSRGYGKEAGPERKMDGKERSGAASPHPCPALNPLERDRLQAGWHHGAWGPETCSILSFLR